MTSLHSQPLIAIACGGTGGHLFPGLAVAEQFVHRNCAVTLLISPKDVDQHAVKNTSGMEIVTLPAVGLVQGRRVAFARGFVQSYRAAKKQFQQRPPRAVLAMGGFTSAPPVLAAKKSGARTFIHESNTVPGRANRWLSWMVHQVFVGFPQAGSRLHNRRVTVTGTPVRPQFRSSSSASRAASACRIALGLEPGRPVLLVMGGSQGARGINDLVVKTLPLLAEKAPPLQLIHLAGPNDAEKIRQTCAELNLKAVVHSFFTEMELALGAATVAVSRAGASSLAELAATRLPAVLVPYPDATDNHQFYNARAFEETGAARLLEQHKANPPSLCRLLLELMESADVRDPMQSALAGWDMPQAAGQIAEEILNTLSRSADHQVRADGANRSRSNPIEQQHPSTA
jgi:UDP-N-acetylglucosamine--N-acetylmuramyl-(pentapeptide) pyrophosphoryl-undecaprenol N-acetylglucosamine transferase